MGKFITKFRDSAPGVMIIWIVVGLWKDAGAQGSEGIQRVAEVGAVGIIIIIAIAVAALLGIGIEMVFRKGD